MGVFLSACNHRHRSFNLVENKPLKEQTLSAYSTEEQIKPR
jgi:hypothetical protein